jgi:nucleoside-diphosphate-sugar epimerase
MKTQTTTLDTSENKRIFISGGTGVMGRRVVPALVEAGCQVTAVGRSQESREWLQRHGANPVALDLFDAQAVGRAVAGHEIVINLTTSIPPTSRIFLPGAWRMNDRIRRFASANLAEAASAAGAERFIQESFAPIYPDCGDRWIDEKVPFQPLKYNRSVLDAEASAQRFSESGGAGVILRFAFFYGPDSPQMVDIIRYVRRGWALIFGAPGAFYPSCSHDDAAAAVIAALNLPTGVYNVTDDDPLTHREFADSLASAVGAKPPRLPAPWMEKLAGSLGETMARSLRISNRKLKSASDWRPRYPSVREGLEAMLTKEKADSSPLPVRAR